MPINIIQNIEKGVLPNTATTQLFLMDVEKFLDALPMQPIFDLVVTSPPYNIGKEYENQVPLSDYYDWQKRIIEKIYPRLKDNGSICWQVGNYVENGSITPLDIELAPIFKELNLHLRKSIFQMILQIKRHGNPCIVSSVTICLCPLYPIRIGASHFRGDISYPSRDLWDSIFLRDITSIELYSQTMQNLC